MKKKLEPHSKLIFEYNKINNNIFIGTNQCCQTHFKKQLLNKGVKADISLEAEKIDAPFGVEYYLWVPVKDGQSPSLKQLEIGANFLKRLVDNNTKVYIHCQHGHARAPTLVAAYFILEGMKLNDTLQLLKRKRPVIHPTPKQITMLKRFEKKFGKN